MFVLRGTAAPGARLAVEINGTRLTDVETDEEGVWQVEVRLPLGSVNTIAAFALPDETVAVESPHSGVTLGIVVPSATPTRAPTRTPTATHTATPEPTPTATHTATATRTPTPLPTATATHTVTPEPTPTVVATPEVTATPGEKETVIPELDLPTPPTEEEATPAAGEEPTGIIPPQAVTTPEAPSLAQPPGTGTPQPDDLPATGGGTRAAAVLVAIAAVLGLLIGVSWWEKRRERTSG